MSEESISDSESSELSSSGSESADYTWQGELPVSLNTTGDTTSIGILTAGPAGGYGSATFRSVTIQPNGLWNATGNNRTVVVPLLK